MINITPDQLWNAIIVALALFAAIVTVDKAIDIVKKWRAPTTDTAKKLATDKQRLDDHDKAIEKLQESNQAICSALLALLDHELHNGNADQMQKARDTLMNYLQSLITK